MQCDINLLRCVMNNFCLDIFRVNHLEEPHQDHSLSKIFLLKCLTLFFLLVSLYPFRAYSTPPDYYKNIQHNNPSLDLEKKLKIEKEIIQLRESVEEEIDNLIVKMRALFNEDFNAHLYLYFSTILIGSFLFLTPSGQVVLMVKTGAIKQLAKLLVITAVLGETTNINHFLSEEQKGDIASITDYFIKHPLLKELFLILLYSTDENSKYLAQSLFQNPTSENLIKKLLPAIAIGGDKYSVATQEAVINVLKRLPNIEKNLRKEAIESLKFIIESNTYPSLRQLAVSVLGDIGKGVEGVADYLISIGSNKNKSDELKFLALIELGRDQNHSLASIEELSTWFKERDSNNNNKPLTIRPEVSDSFIEALLSISREEISEKHIIVVKGFILSKILDFELELKFSETLLKWDDSPETKTFLKEVYLNPAKDINDYVKKDLFKESLSDDDYEILDFLTNKLSGLAKSNPIEVLYKIEPIIADFKIAYPNQVEIAQTLEWLTAEVKVLEKPNPIEVLYKIEPIIKDFKKDYPNQVEIAQKLENIVNFYKKMLESIQN